MSVRAGGQVVLAYEVVDDGDMVLVYYFLTPQGRVAAVFVGET